MSDNKYIIDKDSLTGIADAVRNKLGTGEATTDPQTGDIVYPEDKGYYLKYTTTAQWEEGTLTDTYSGTGTSYATRARITEEQLLRVCNGIRPVYVKIDVVLDSPSNDGIVVENSLTNWSSSNHIVTLPTSGQFKCQYSYYHYSDYGYHQKTIPAITFSFLDENQKIIIPENASDIISKSNRKNLSQSSINEPIPFSIGDIQNKITNYLKGSPKIVPRSSFGVKGTRGGTSTDLTGYGGLSNIYLIVGILNNKLTYLDMINHPDKVGDYGAYRFYYYETANGTEQTSFDAQYDTSNNKFYRTDDYYGSELSPCVIVYKEA